jgi:hypothetical protein
MTRRRHSCSPRPIPLRTHSANGFLHLCERVRTLRFAVLPVLRGRSDCQGKDCERQQAASLHVSPSAPLILAGATRPLYANILQRLPMPDATGRFRSGPGLRVEWGFCDSDRPAGWSEPVSGREARRVGARRPPRSPTVSRNRYNVAWPKG